MKRVLERILLPHITLTRLLKAAQSPRLRDVFASEFHVTTTPGGSLATLTKLRIDYERLGEKICNQHYVPMDYKKHRAPPSNLRVSAHCECILASYLTQNNILTLSFLGVSKLACGPCWLFLRTLISTVREHNPLSIWSSHQK